MYVQVVCHFMVILLKNKQYFLILHHKYAVLFWAFSTKSAGNSTVLKINYKLRKITLYLISYKILRHLLNLLIHYLDFYTVTYISFFQQNPLQAQRKTQYTQVHNMACNQKSNYDVKWGNTVMHHVKLLIQYLNLLIYVLIVYTYTFTYNFPLFPLKTWLAVHFFQCTYLKVFVGNL